MDMNVQNNYAVYKVPLLSVRPAVTLPLHSHLVSQRDLGFFQCST